MKSSGACLAALLLACGADAGKPKPSASASPTPGAPVCVSSDCDGPAYPRIANYRIETYVDAEAEALLGRVDLAIVDAEAHALDPAVLPRVVEVNPSMDLLAYLTSEEIARDPSPEEQPLAALRFERIPPAFWLTEPGSLTSEPIDAKATSIRVADPSAFSVTHPRSDFYPADEPVYLLLGDEHVKLVGIKGDRLQVERGFRSAAASHPAGTRIAKHVVFFGGTWMLDIAATAPVDPTSGQRWKDFLAQEAAGLVKDGPWTGVFLDVCFSDVGFLNAGVLDVDRDGEADDPAAASAAWSQGFGQMVSTLRQTLGPDVPLVANPGAQDCPHADLDGILLEGWPIGLPPSFLTFDKGLERYLGWTSRKGRRALSVANAFSPKIGFGTIEPGQDEIARQDYASMRFGLATALLGDGYYAFDNGVFGHYVAWSYDAYDGAGRGRGWLGYPIAAPVALEGGAWMREFEHGLAVSNPTDAPLNVTVPSGFAKLAGTDDPAHDDGAAVAGSLTVGPKDGYLLVRE